MSAKRLLLWRHGRTEWNASGRIQGQADIALDEIGARQARQAALLLAAENPDAIVASDLVRTYATAQALSEVTALPVATDKRLRERHFGPWQGLTTPDLLAEYADAYALWKSGHEPGVEGIETNAQMTERVLAGVRAAVGEHSGTVVIVTHGGAAYRAVLGLLEWPPEVAWRLEPLGNCRWAELQQTSRGWRIHGYNVGPLAGAAGPHAPVTTADVEG